MNEPLWMPAGSVRALLAFLLVGAAVAGVFVLENDAAGLLLGLAGAVTAFYFRTREDEE